MRLALYIRSIGVAPNIAGQNYCERLTNLGHQFEQLDANQRRDAKKRGRQLISELGFDKATEDLVTLPACGEKHERFRQKRLEQMKHWPEETPPCPECQVKRFKLPKKSWKSRGAAEEELARHKHAGLVVYPCPAHEGFWHLGHPKQRKNSNNDPATKETGAKSHDK